MKDLKTSSQNLAHAHHRNKINNSARLSKD